MPLALCILTISSQLLAVAVMVTWPVGERLRATALRSAWKWALAAEFAWLASCVAAAIIPEKIALLDQFWSWSAILACCPFISALGSRHPTDRVWNGFIILPLVAVLGWPAITAWGYADQLVPVRLAAPAVLGFAIVLIMGTGNYLGTRFAGPAAVAGVAVAVSLTPLLSRWEMTSDNAALVRATCAGSLAGAVLWARRLASRPHPPATTPLDGLWMDFRDTFGVVWGVRIQERVNATAAQENWCCRLDPWGCHWEQGVTPERKAATLIRMEQTVRWLLRRFVDVEWIDTRLRGKCEEESPLSL